MHDEYVEQIVQAYLSTKMTVTQFEALVRQALVAHAGSVESMARYDQGFSEGYDQGHREGFYEGQDSVKGGR